MKFSIFYLLTKFLKFSFFQIFYYYFYKIWMRVLCATTQIQCTKNIPHICKLHNKNQWNHVLFIMLHVCSDLGYYGWHGILEVLFQRCFGIFALENFSLISFWPLLIATYYLFPSILFFNFKNDEKIIQSISIICAI